MYAAAESGLVQRLIGESARRFQAKVEAGEEKIVGVNAYRIDEDSRVREPLPKPDPAWMRTHVARFRAWKEGRSFSAVAHAKDDLARAAHDLGANVFAAVVAAAEAGCTHGEICATLRRELGFGHVRAVV
jgi:methylmalonyl-CoA mutase N-terminal domain/subunit